MLQVGVHHRDIARWRGQHAFDAGAGETAPADAADAADAAEQVARLEIELFFFYFRRECRLPRRAGGKFTRPAKTFDSD